MADSLTVTLYGGAESVTGSNFLVENTTTGKKLLIDCGIEQGKDYSEAKAYAPFPYEPQSIDALFITHAHLDHVGRAPRLVKEGFSGTVYMTPPTRDLAEAILKDSADILGKNAKDHGLPPLYEAKDVYTFLSLIETIPYREEREVADGLSIYLRDTGHILGSASIRVKTKDGTSFAVTSDLGNSPALLLPDAESIPDADVILLESVYGDRANPEKEHRLEKLEATLKEAIARGGAILLPAFSIERTQLMLYEIGQLMEEKKIPTVPVFLDSPLAIEVTDIYRKWGGTYFNKEARAEAKDHDLFKFPFLRMTPSREESESIRKESNPKIIMAGAGMSHGGRIGKWEREYLPDQNTTLLMVGYQAPGSPGRLLQDGARHIRLEGRNVDVRARVETLHGWSGHADRDGLLAFAERCAPTTKSFIVGMGEPSSARFLAQRIHGFLGRPAIVPMEGQSFMVTKEGAVFLK